jgi:trans-aconitate 2-methyltransferase
LNDSRDFWDAQTYDEISRIVQYQWGLQVLKWREWNGKEIIMDAGCGSGLLTKLLAKKVPRGKVYAVDIDVNMIRQAKRNLGDLQNVEIVLADLTKVKLDLELDIIFSNAVLHWVHDHTQVFHHFWKMLKYNGLEKTELLIQCGGYGNLRRTLAVLQKIGS